jgi:hypothetical protein
MLRMARVAVLAALCLVAPACASESPAKVERTPNTTPEITTPAPQVTRASTTSQPAPPTTRPVATLPPTTQAPTTPGNGATAMCVDGSYSYAAHHQGACSHHGGVAQFYK